MYNFTLVNADTDSISFCKPSGEEFTEQEQVSLLKEINSLLPEKIHFEHDGIFKSVICLKAKNYVLWDGKKLKKKGSALKSSTLEPALKEFLDEIINCIITEKYNYQEIYYKYVKEVNNITDIKRWASKKTLSEKTYKSERANETKIIDAIEGSEYKEGDRIYVFFDDQENLELVENFKGLYNKKKYYQKLFSAGERFETIINNKELFPNLSLKRNQKLLEEILK